MRSHWAIGLIIYSKNQPFCQGEWTYIVNICTIFSEGVKDGRLLVFGASAVRLRMREYVLGVLARQEDA